MTSFFDLGTKVVTDIYPNVIFQVVQEETHGWVLQTISKRCESQVMSPVMDLKEGDIVYISHSSPMSMKAVNDTEATQNNQDTAQSGQYVPEDAGEVTVSASAVQNNSIGIGAEIVRAMINNAERNGL